MNVWLVFIWNHWRPREGWLALSLLIAVVLCLQTAVAEVGWVNDDRVIGWGLAGGLAMGYLLAKRPSSPRFSWTLIILYAAAYVTTSVADLWPGFSEWRGGWPALTQFWRQNGALFLDRAGSWLQAAVSGGASQETAVFLWGMAVLGWLLAAFAAWTVFRLRKPLWGLTAVGLAITINSYFGHTKSIWLILFVGLGTLLTAVIHFNAQEMRWQAASVDYSDEVRLDLYLHAGAAAMGIMMAAMLLPAFSLSQAARAFQELPWVVNAERRLEEVFAGVEQPGRRPPPDSPGGAGAMPRSFLLGDPPELYETIVMTAVVTLNGEPLPFTQMAGTHWRGLSYDVYTGRGWALSEEREQPVAAGELIDLPETGNTAVTQSVNWLFDQRRLRYTLGLPRQFDDPVMVSWRGLTDFSRVLAEPGMFTAVSYLNPYTTAQIQQTALADVPPALLARYTALPAGVPERVAQLAQDVAADLQNPYDQARALEQFLRQYPYSLNVPLPPENVDPVDYFLFDLQAGYCDYYASAMVVMARSLGIPSRIGIGYLPQPPDEKGVQQVAQINGHSWAEVYFAGIGWVEFEPTAAFVTPHDMRTGAAETTAVVEEDPIPQTPLPPPTDGRRENALPWGWWLAGVGAVLAIVWWRRRQKRPDRGEEVIWAYGRLQASASRIGHNAQPGETPTEFSLGLVGMIRPFIPQNPRLAAWFSTLPENIERLAHLYSRRQYSPHKSGSEEEAMRHWQQLRLPLLFLRIVTVVQGENRKRERG